MRPYLLIGLTACLPNVDLGAQTRITCAADGDCPDGWSCASTAVCLKKRRTDDLLPPALASVAAIDAHTIAVSFDELVDMSAAELTFAPPLPVRSLKIDGASVTLDTGTQSAIIYSLTIDGVRDVLGNAAQTLGAQFTGIGVPVDPSAPTLVAPDQGAVVRTGEVVLSWNGRLGATRYDVIVARDPSFTDPVPGSPFEVEAPSTSLAITLSDPVRYYWRVSSDVSGASESRFDAIGDTVYVRCSNVCDDTDTAGNLSHPRANLSLAIAAARALGIAHIHVAEGTYAGPVSIDAGRSLIGGFDATFSSHEPKAHATQIFSDDIFTLHVVGKDGAPASVIEGLELFASGASGSATLSISNATSALVVRNNTIHASTVGARLLSSSIVFEGNTVFFGDSTVMGVTVINGSPTLQGNSISATLAAPAVSSTTALSIQGSAVVVGNDISLSGPYNEASGIVADGAGTALTRNTLEFFGAGNVRAIIGKAGSIAENQIDVDGTGINIGIVLQGAATVERNRIHAGTGSQRANFNRGLSIEFGIDDGAAVTVRNNVIVAGDVEPNFIGDAESNAIRVQAPSLSGSAQLIVTNNTLVSGSSEPAAGDTCTIAMFGTSVTPTTMSLRNNLLLAQETATSARHGTLCRSDVGVVFGVVAKNHIASGSGTLGRFPGETFTTVAAFDSALGCNFGAGSTALCAATPPVFVDTIDYRLSPFSHDSLRELGIAATAPEVGGVIVDLDGAPRTCSGLVCYSLGAYELD